MASSTSATTVADARPPPVRPTAGPPQRTDVVSLTLLDELHALDGKFRTREKELAEQQLKLDEERDRFEKAVMAKEWVLQRERHELHAEKETFNHVTSSADAVASYQGAKISVVASGGEPLHTTIETLTKREPTSGLAAAARALISAPTPDGSALAAPTLYVDREPAVTHIVVEWLRDGPGSLARLPRAVLQQLAVEAAHWRMRTLAAQIAERLGKADASSEGLDELEWTIGQLQLHTASRPALCRAAADQLRRWLAKSRERRRLAARQGRQTCLAVLDAMEAHASDLPLLTAGLGCAVLLGAEPEGRPAIRTVMTRLEELASVAEGLAARTAAEVSGPEADNMAAAEDAAEAVERLQRAEAAEAAAAVSVRVKGESEAAKLIEAATEAATEVAVASTTIDDEAATQAAPAADAAAQATEDVPAAVDVPADDAPATDAPAADAPTAVPTELAPDAPVAAEVETAPAAAPPATQAMAAEEEAAVGAEAPAEVTGGVGGGTEASANVASAVVLTPKSTSVPAPGPAVGEDAGLAVHQSRTVASAAISVRERRELARRCEREVGKVRRVLVLCR